MKWVVLSLLTAAASASTDAWTKKFFGRRSAMEMAVFPLAYSLPLFLGTLPFVTVPPLDTVFWWSFAASIPLNCVAFYLYMAAIRQSPLSLTLPFLSLTPVFMIVTGFLVLGEVPSPVAVGGMLAVVGGGYLLNAPSIRRGLLGPLAAVRRERGTLLMISVACIYSFSAVVGKKAILHSSPFFFGMFFFPLQNFLLLVWAFATKSVDRRLLVSRNAVTKGVLVGLFYYCHVLCHVWAISLTQASYMIALKRLSVLFGLVYGALLFREEHLRWRFAGAGAMVAGAAAIALAGGH
ncbi:EamA-like transporter family protein [Desulfacinum hydrothermale DSM 13146]|uniref:EamA-like transporter family protein n=1 Tax=Desulfacinum hydrothermale DSM 13146 TaxID=1121390 RepID=A0A1W1X8R1_9BACT|nr:EamA family transporter [Desulfacinum hydrothermale]SMC20326.1 EamA-like transporter family protein [Desulfacinum hydrothermale DSM 13146]